MPADPILDANESLATRLTQAIHSGDLAVLEELLKQSSEMASIRIRDPETGDQRTLLHIATDWPGHFPQVAETIALLVGFGADVNARFVGAHSETPLHWAASSNDVAAVDALVDVGADLEVDGSVIDGGTPLANAVGFGQWDAAHQLVRRGSRTSVVDEAALGLVEGLARRFETGAPPSQAAVNDAFWMACSAGQQQSADFLLRQGADINWIPEWDDTTPLDVARTAEFRSLAGWLEDRGGLTAVQKPG